jgi:hypothetical protein
VTGYGRRFHPSYYIGGFPKKTANEFWVTGPRVSDSPPLFSMVLDTSAILAVLLAEPGNERLTTLISRSPMVVVGAPTMVETAMVSFGEIDAQRPAHCG